MAFNPVKALLCVNVSVWLSQGETVLKFFLSLGQSIGEKNRKYEGGQNEELRVVITPSVTSESTGPLMLSSDVTTP